jgi:hypothetical protein
MSEEPKSFWGKLAAITAFLGALAAVGGLVTKCAEPEQPSTTTYAPTPPVTPPTPAWATVCMTTYGGCPLIQTMSPGMVCTCYNVFGIPVISGIAR